MLGKIMLDDTGLLRPIWTCTLDFELCQYPPEKPLAAELFLLISLLEDQHQNKIEATESVTLKIQLLNI